MGPKPSTKGSEVDKRKVGRPPLRNRSESKTECKFESKSESNETKKLAKEDAEDTSVLHPPIDLSASGLRQVSKIFEKGTAEIQDLLSFECDVIYECKVCRNLFRSVANFISHKRIYCTTQYQTCNELLSLNNKLEDFYNSLNPGDAAHPNVVKSKLKNPSRMTPRPDLASVINSCIQFRSPVLSRSSKNGCGDGGDYSLHLQAMQGSKLGVFQTATQNSLAGRAMSMRDQMQELYSPQRGTAIVERESWGVGGEENGAFEFTNGIVDSESNRTYTCDQCGLPCASLITLMRHKKLIHQAAQTCYLCPCCKSSFPTTWSVHRHLFKAHHKTNEQVRKLRLQIKSKVMQPGEVLKGMTDKMKMNPQKVSDQQKWELENEEWLDQLGKDVDLLRCGICGRKFERRAALKAHYQICQKRVASVSSSMHYRPTPEKEANHSEPKAKPITDMKLLPVVSLTALTPQQIKENLHSKSGSPEKKKIGIQVRMDYCKKSSSHIADATSEMSERLVGFSKPNPIELITIDDDRTIVKPKSCLETLLTENRVTEKRNNRSDSGNDSESLDDVSVALDFSSDSVADEDAIKLNMYDILGISFSESNADNTYDSSLNVESSNSNCDDFSSDDTVIPNKRKKSHPVKRFTCNAVDRSKFDCDNRDVEIDETKRLNRTNLWSGKSNDMDCVFRKENVKNTYTSCKLKNCRPEPDRICNGGVKPTNSFSNGLIEKLANYYDKASGLCLLCNKKFDCMNILFHVTEHGSWLKYVCKWPQCDHKSSSKTELMKHIVKEHQENSDALEYIEPISKEDWTFQIALAKNHLKKPSLLLFVNKLKEKLNCPENSLKPVTQEEPKMYDSQDRVPSKANDLPLKESVENEGSDESNTKVEDSNVDMIESTQESETDDKNSSAMKETINSSCSNEVEMAQRHDSVVTEDSIAAPLNDVEMAEGNDSELMEDSNTVVKKLGMKCLNNTVDESEDTCEKIAVNDEEKSFGAENSVVVNEVEIADANHSADEDDSNNAPLNESKTDASNPTDAEEKKASSMESSAAKSCLSEGENSNHSEVSNYNLSDDTDVVEEIVEEEEFVEEELVEEEIVEEETIEEEIVCNAVESTSDCCIDLTEDVNDEKRAPSPDNSIRYDTPTTSYDDDGLSDSQCEDLADSDPSCTVLDKSEMEVELDDDQLRAVMMEMIFGQPNDECAVSPSTEFSAKNIDGSKKRKLDTELNV